MRVEDTGPPKNFFDNINVTINVTVPEVYLTKEITLSGLLFQGKGRCTLEKKQ